MRKLSLVIFILVLISGVTACSDNGVKSNTQSNTKVINPEKADVREVVWQQLSAEDKNRIDGSWNDGKVSKISLRKDMMQLVDDQSYAGKEVYIIDFPTTDISRPNNILVYADVKTLHVIGYGLVD